MTADKVQLSSMTTRQKVIAGVVVLIVIFLIWQIKGLFGNSSSTAPAPVAVQKTQPMMTAANNNGQPMLGAPGAPSTAASTSSQQNVPKPAQLPQPALTPREAELLKLQQDTEAKYLEALNELQILKVNQAIAETNKAIATAKLDTVTAQKGVVDMLSGPVVSSANYAQSLGGAPVGTQTSTTTTRTAAPSQQIDYTVISVSQLQYKWNAVIGNQGNLYSVTIGDKLPPDGSKVIAIDKSGVWIEKDGGKRKLSMVPII